MTKLKICGLRDVGHAVVAADAGADFLGFVFVAGVPRQLTREQAMIIIDKYRREISSGGPLLVGLFANQPLDEVNTIVRACGLDQVQLCGSELPEYSQGVTVPIIQQVKVHVDRASKELKDDTLRRVDEVVASHQKPLLDRHETGFLGGTGRTFDWDIARHVSEHHDIFLAGGLTINNVSEAIQKVDPWGVDVSSGVETEGVKDRGKIEQFTREVHMVD